MSLRKRSGCFVWSGSILTSIFLGTLFVAVIIFGIVKIAFLQIVWREEKIKNELETSLNSFPPFPNSNTLSYDVYIEKNEACLVTGPLVIIDTKYSVNAQPISVFNYYNQHLQEQGWLLEDHSDWNADIYYKQAIFYKESAERDSFRGGYYVHLEYLQEGIYQLKMEWVGGRYTCH